MVFGITRRAHEGGVGRTRGKGRGELRKPASAGRSSASRGDEPGPKEEGGTEGMTGRVPGRLSGDGAIGWTEETRELGEHWRPAKTEARS